MPASVAAPKVGESLTLCRASPGSVYWRVAVLRPARSGSGSGRIPVRVLPAGLTPSPARFRQWRERPVPFEASRRSCRHLRVM